MESQVATAFRDCPSAACTTLLIQRPHAQKRTGFNLSELQAFETEGYSSTLGGNVNWCSHYGKQHGSSLKN